MLDVQLREAKSDVRSFLLTGDSTYLVRYRASLDTARAALDSLDAYTADDPAQQARLRALRPLVDERLRNFARTLALPSVWRAVRQAGGSGDSLQARLTTGERLSREINAGLAAVDDLEGALLDRRAAAQHVSAQAARLVVLVLGIGGVLLAWAMRRAIGRDLDERRRAEAAVRASEAKFAGILAIAADAIISVDQSQAIRHFNHGAEEIFGYRADEMIGQPLEKLLPERLAAAHHAHVAAFGRGPDSARRMGERRQVLGRRRTGEDFPADASISKLLTPDGPLFTVVLRDVSEQQRLQRHEHVLAGAGRQLVGTLEYDAILDVVAELPVPEIGDWCLLDILEEQPSGQRALRRITSRCAAPELDHALRALEVRGIDTDSPSPVVDVLRTGDPQLVPEVEDDWLEAHAEREELATLRALGVRSLLLVPLAAAERVVGVMTIGTGPGRRPLDGADRSLAQALADRAILAIENARNYRHAQRARALREEVLSVVSHDLRNPLSAVAMCTRTLLEHPPSEETERRRLCESALEATEWMNRLMQDLLDAASIDAGRLSVEPEPQSAPALVEATLNMFAPRAATQQVVLASEMPSSVPLVYADGARVIQLLANLVSNAIKYTPAGGRVTIGAAPRVGEVLLWVRDTGAGIAPDHVPHVFDRFWHHRGTSRARGTGLGLAIARGIVLAHGGRIWVESAVGVGSTFYFTLPASATPSPFTWQREAERRDLELH